MNYFGSAAQGLAESRLHLETNLYFRMAKDRLAVLDSSTSQPIIEILFGYLDVKTRLFVSHLESTKSLCDQDLTVLLNVEPKSLKVVAVRKNWHPSLLVSRTQFPIPQILLIPPSPAPPACRCCCRT